MTNPFSRFVLATLLALASTVPAVGALPSSGPASTVVYVSGSDLVLKASDGSILNYTVPAGYKFASGGKQVALTDLKPGAALTAPVSTGVDPQVIASVAVVKAKVYAVTPPDGVTLILSDGSKDFTVPSGVTFNVGGTPTTLLSLKPDSMVDVTLLTPAPDANPVPPPATPPLSGALLIAKTEDLPSAGTNLPLYGIAGLCMVLLGAAFLSFRKRATVRRK